jgi:hypothetical protein
MCGGDPVRTGMVILFLLGGACITGQALRVMSQYFFAPGSVYVPNAFDILFDWLIMLVFGICIIAYALANHDLGRKSEETASIEKVFVVEALDP